MSIKSFKLEIMNRNWTLPMDVWPIVSFALFKNIYGTGCIPCLEFVLGKFNKVTLIGRRGKMGQAMWLKHW